MHYILALLPPKAAIWSYIQAAQLLFAPCSEGYLLSACSLPHITLCQFDCDREEEAREVWREFAHLSCHFVPVRFTGLSLIKGRGAYAGCYWAELSIAREEEILRAHRLALDILAAHHFGCINERCDRYCPHLTLAKIHLPEVFRRWPENLLDCPGLFRIVLGVADDHWQYLYTLCEEREHAHP